MHSQEVIMDKGKLKQEILSFPDYLLAAWKGGDFSFLIKSLASYYIKSILVKKGKSSAWPAFFW